MINFVPAVTIIDPVDPLAGAAAELAAWLTERGAHPAAGQYPP